MNNLKLTESIDFNDLIIINYENNKDIINDENDENDENNDNDENDDDINIEYAIIKKEDINYEKEIYNDNNMLLNNDSLNNIPLNNNPLNNDPLNNDPLNNDPLNNIPLNNIPLNNINQKHICIKNNFKYMCNYLNIFMKKMSSKVKLNKLDEFFNMKNNRLSK